MLKSRADAKLNQSRCFGALQRYLFYGGDFIRRTTLTDPALQALTSEQLLAKIGGLMGKQHEVLYYGPQKETEVKSALAEHHKSPPHLQPLEKKFSTLLPTDANKVVHGSVRRQTALLPAVLEPRREIRRGGRSRNRALQRIFRRRHEHHRFPRDARGARSGVHGMGHPRYAEQRQRRLQLLRLHRHAERQDAEAVEAFDDIINNMPESEKAFGIAKEALVSRLRTERTVKDGVLWSYLRARDLGLDAPRDKQIFEKVQSMTLDDVKAAQQKWVKGRKYVYGILGDIQDLDLNYLKTLGPIQTVSQEEIFGY